MLPNITGQSTSITPLGTAKKSAWFSRGPQGSPKTENIAYTVGTGTLQPTFNTEFGGEVDIALAIIAFPLSP